MSLTHPKLRTSDFAYAVREANILASRSGIRHRISIERPDVPAKGVAYLVDEAVPTRQERLHLEKYHVELQDSINKVIERITTSFTPVREPRIDDLLGLVNTAFNSPGRW